MPDFSKPEKWYKKKNRQVSFFARYIRIVRQMTGLLSSNLCKKIVKKSIWKFTDMFPNQVPNFLNIFTEHGNIIADYTKS